MSPCSMVKSFIFARSSVKEGNIFWMTYKSTDDVALLQNARTPHSVYILELTINSSLSNEDTSNNLVSVDCGYRLLAKVRASSYQLVLFVLVNRVHTFSYKVFQVWDKIEKGNKWALKGFLSNSKNIQILSYVHIADGAPCLLGRSRSITTLMTETL